MRDANTGTCGHTKQGDRVDHGDAKWHLRDLHIGDAAMTNAEMLEHECGARHIPHEFTEMMFEKVWGLFKTLLHYFCMETEYFSNI